MLVGLLYTPHVPHSQYQAPFIVFCSGDGMMDVVRRTKIRSSQLAWWRRGDVIRAHEPVLLTAVCNVHQSGLCFYSMTKANQEKNQIEKMRSKDLNHPKTLDYIGKASRQR